MKALKAKKPHTAVRRGEMDHIAEKQIYMRNK